MREEEEEEEDADAAAKWRRKEILPLSPSLSLSSLQLALLVGLLRHGREQDGVGGWGRGG